MKGINFSNVKKTPIITISYYNNEQEYSYNTRKIKMRNISLRIKAKMSASFLLSYIQNCIILVERGSWKC